MYVKTQEPKVRLWNQKKGDGRVILTCRVRKREGEKWIKASLKRSCTAPFNLGPWTTEAQALLHADAFRDQLEFSGAAGGGRKRAVPDAAPGPAVVLGRASPRLRARDTARERWDRLVRRFADGQRQIKLVRAALTDGSNTTMVHRLHREAVRLLGRRNCRDLLAASPPLPTFGPRVRSGRAPVLVLYFFSIKDSTSAENTDFQMRIVLRPNWQICHVVQY